MFVAITLPFFNELLGFFGGFAFAPTTYFVSNYIYIFYWAQNQPALLHKISHVGLMINLNPSNFFTYQLPCIMWLSIYKPRKFGLSWFINWVTYFETSNITTFLASFLPSLK